MEHYYSKKPTTPLKVTKKKVTLRGVTFSLYFASGVFSSDRVDPGSTILIETADVKQGDHILDLGCGNGVVGIALLKSEDCTAAFTDVNERACKITQKNLKLNRIEGNVVCGEFFEKVSGKFNVILLNPPTHAGKDICLRLIEESKDYLKKKGYVQIIARHNRGGKPLQQKMEEVFGDVEIIERKGGFRIYRSYA